LIANTHNLIICDANGFFTVLYNLFDQLILTKQAALNKAHTWPDLRIILIDRVGVLCNVMTGHKQTQPDSQYKAITSLILSPPINLLSLAFGLSLQLNQREVCL
jgi:hypothetical protein